MVNGYLVILGEWDDEEDGGDIVEAVDPLLPLRPLAADVEHVEGHALHQELDLHDARGHHTGVEDVLKWMFSHHVTLVSFEVFLFWVNETV